jgi:ADP-ribosylglycohydrolase
MDKKISAAFILSCIGDIIGFGNGITEFNASNRFNQDNYGDKFEQAGADYSNELVFNFINDGGFSTHPKPECTVSDDTIMTHANTKALIKWFKEDSTKSDIDLLIRLIKKEYIELIKERVDLERFEGMYKGGITTVRYLKKLMGGDDYKTWAYDDKAGGSGGSMRSGVFGIVLSKPSEQLKLIASCIESTCLTHPNTIAMLGSIMVGLFASYAVQGKPPIRWCVDGLDVLESETIDKYIESTRESWIPFYQRDKKIFVNKWKDYMEDRFDDFDFSYKFSPVMKYPSKRTLFYNKFSSRKKDVYPGAGGDDSVIIAYDCLIDSQGSWDKIVFYSMLHVGDSDTTGTICGLLYGLVYGLDRVHSQMLINHIDLKSQCLNLGTQVANILK